ncbi:hypothetical protein [Agrobacterium vitis]|uniref:hypothetical protein n=1 Tax=Agrobacterium vitis TaxID=373 RepID=UPI0012E77844|nr:hypothetical protein [Agrobacterium vitis]MVA32847.1 hypothetical protein [Agrobacterium vitis]
MIENLLIGCSAYFFERKKALTDSAVENWFAELQRDAQNAMTPLFKEIRKMHGEVRYSTICFAYDRPTAFLNKDAGVVDRIHGYMLIVEHQNHVAVHSIGLKLSLNIKKDWLKPVANNAVNAAIAKAGSKFESMQLRSMSTSNRVLRKKTMEADDLENAMPMAGASRYVGQRYRLRRGTQRYTATPSTGRISLSTDRSGFKTAISWSVDVMAELEVSTGALSPFIENFARPVSLTSIPLTAKPTNFAIDVAELTDRIFSEYSTIKLVKKDLKGQFRELNETECRKILQILDGEFKVAGSRDSLNILNLTDNSKVGTLRWGKDRIGLSTFALQETKGIYVASADDIDHGKNRLSLKIYLDSENLFIILFDTINLVV